MSKTSRRCSPERGRGAPVTLVTALTAFASRAWAETNAVASDARRVALEVLADDRFQTELPKTFDLDSGIRVFSLFRTLGPLATLFLLLLAGALVVLLVIWWFTEARLRGRDDGEAQADAAADPKDNRGLIDLRRPERLAAEGRYDDAIHHLLLIAIERLCRRSSTRADPARTSRELLGLIPLEGDARAGFAGLVRAVELAYFGGLPAGPEEYRMSLSHFRAALGEGYA